MVWQLWNCILTSWRLLVRRHLYVANVCIANSGVKIHDHIGAFVNQEVFAKLSLPPDQNQSKVKAAYWDVEHYTRWLAVPVGRPENMDVRRNHRIVECLREHCSREEGDRAQCVRAGID